MRVSLCPGRDTGMYMLLYLPGTCTGSVLFMRGAGGREWLAWGQGDASGGL